MERPGEKLYVPYRDARQAQDWVSWDSILGLAMGEWRGDAWKMEELTIQLAIEICCDS